jgi:proteasome assembly chaperone (PAC2) family protein
LWLSQKRGIPGVSLWPEVALYFAAIEDPKAVKVVLSFFNKRLALGLDLTELDAEIEDQSKKITQLRREDLKIDRYIRTLEAGLSMDEEEQLTLAQTVAEFLKETPV